jgi:unsaturated chondroitin disaccharide hydrolase
MHKAACGDVAALKDQLAKVFSLAETKTARLDRAWNAKNGSPVVTRGGTYAARNWTQWTQGFQYGMALLVFDATASAEMLRIGRGRTLERMLPHVTHAGVHDHGFNNLSTYGNLLRLLREGKIKDDSAGWQAEFYAAAIQCSGAVQAMRWSGVAVAEPSPHSAGATSLGYIYSFNGPHSLFVDTLRTTRILGLAWRLGHVLMHERDKSASLLKRSVLHGLTTSQYIVFHGDSAHTYDVAGRTAHEAIFNRNDGRFVCRSTQQGYSPFSTWTRGLAWALLGFAEELEFFATIDAAAFKMETGLEKRAVVTVYERCARETADHYLGDATAGDGIPYWDSGAPGLEQLGDWRNRPADPFNDHEPVDSSAAAIAAQGLLRLGKFLGTSKGKKYSAAGVSIARTLFSEPYLAVDAKHQGLLLHSIYHRPNNWDFVPKGRKIPCGESSMWGDYHLLELALLLWREIAGEPYLTFFATGESRNRRGS